MSPFYERFTSTATGCCVTSDCFHFRVWELLFRPKTIYERQENLAKSCESQRLGDSVISEQQMALCMRCVVCLFTLVKRQFSKWQERDYHYRLLCAILLKRSPRPGLSHIIVYMSHIPQGQEKLRIQFWKMKQVLFST